MLHSNLLQDWTRPFYNYLYSIWKPRMQESTERRWECLQFRRGFSSRHMDKPKLLISAQCDPTRDMLLNFCPQITWGFSMLERVLVIRRWFDQTVQPAIHPRSSVRCWKVERINHYPRMLPRMISFDPRKSEDRFAGDGICFCSFPSERFWIVRYSVSTGRGWDMMGKR